MERTYDGDWKGTTDQGYEVSFTVSDDVVTTFEIKYYISGSYCRGRLTRTGGGNWPIIDNTFIIEGRSLDSDCDDDYENYRLRGTFSNPSSCSGSWYAEYCYCDGERSGKWTAYRGPKISVSPSWFHFGETILQVVDSFDSPDRTPQGLAFDGTYLWNADYTNQKIYKLDTSGNIIGSFDSPGPYPYGLAFDGTYLWNADSTSLSAKIYKLDTSGNIIDSFDSPRLAPEGLAFDGTYLWNADSTWLSAKIYKLDTSGNIIDSFDSPGLAPEGLAFDGTYLWNADSINNKIYKLDTSGNIIDSFDSPDRTPAGLAFDGTYLWNADWIGAKVYKLEQTGGVNLGASESATFTVSNMGTLNLVIGSLSITGTDAQEFGIEKNNCSGQTVPSSGTCTFDVVFSPTSAGEKSANLSIMSNDPSTPTLTVPLGGTVVDLPAVKAMPWVPLLLLED